MTCGLLSTARHRGSLRCSETEKTNSVMQIKAVKKLHSLLGILNGIRETIVHVSLLKISNESYIMRICQVCLYK